ncbi:MAG: caspase family protein [Sphingomonadaceae bacterium]
MSLQRFYLFAVATLCALAAALLANPAHARKVALVIANAEYQATSPLSNPPSDAALVAEAAKQAGFDDVTLVTDVGMEAFEAALREFRKKADGAEVAMVYYAGHGMEGKGKNWLLPVDAKLEAERDLPYEAIELDLVMDAMYGAQVRMVVLDACRNNPYANKWSSSTRAVARGLVPVEQDDVIVIYAAAPGMVAFDGDGNSPFAKSLAKRLPQPDLPLQLLGGTVRDDVLAETEGDQRPFVSASVTGTPIYLVPRTPGSVPGKPIRFVIDKITVTCISKTSGPGKDEIYLLINTGDRRPERSGDKISMGKGDSWTVEGSFSSIAPITLTLMEADWIGDDDNLGLIQTGTSEGSFSKTLRNDGGEYVVTYDLRLGD